MYGIWFALTVRIADCEGEFYPEIKKKYGLIEDTEVIYTQKVRPKKEVDKYDISAKI